MIRRKNNIFIAVLITIFSFFTVTYMSCSKGFHGHVGCEGVLCENDGYCHIDTLTHKPKCVCPVGYEGSNCATVSVAKYLAAWTVKQKILGSDSTMYNGDSLTYIAFLRKSGTPTTFFIDNFFNNPYYNDIICTLDSMNSSHFLLDTLSAYHMVYNNFKVVSGSGYIYHNDSIYATIIVRYKNKTTNWEKDTLGLTMKLHSL